MSTVSNSPTGPTSQKRPLDNPSSPALPDDQPQTKRKALTKDAETTPTKELKTDSTVESEKTEPASRSEKTTKPESTVKSEKADKGESLLDSWPSITRPSPTPEQTGLQRAPSNDGDGPSQTSGTESTAPTTVTGGTQPIQSTTSSTSNSNSYRRNGSGKPASNSNNNGHHGNHSSHGHHGNSQHHSANLGSANARDDESNAIYIRSIISTQEAATIIGKGGENVTSIRRASQAKCTVSDYSRGATERILTVSGTVENVAKAFGLIIRTLNNEPLEEPSTPNSKTYPLQLLIPHVLVGSIIGKQGVRIREIQEASTARLNVSDQCLPQSSERKLVILGVADAVHIATYYVAKTLYEQLVSYGGPAASAYASKTGEAVTGPSASSLHVVPYIPMSVGGQWGQPENPRRPNDQQQQSYRPLASPSVPYHQSSQSGHHYPSGGPVGYNGSSGGQPPVYPAAHGSGALTQPPARSGQENARDKLEPPVVQHIYIPNDMVGAIIGKGGSKINEIRSLSGSTIKINEPQDNSERLVTISGTAYSNQMALYMLYSRLENEKHRV